MTGMSQRAVGKIRVSKMANYNFNKTVSVERLDENHAVSNFKLIKSLVVALLLGGNILYVQYILFFRNVIRWSYTDTAYLTTLLIYFVPAATNTFFSIRIHTMSENSNDTCNFATTLIVTGVL
ncbi:hypothetical protein TcasGA2_TC004851 [Tribolium castaneum]|uniref:Uncharacterized protein n=1 Tax=Tribolium castaneum TaxID=7070 RepID=D6WBJ0_TRICA|nr:hypothetical protein TcasGA2_TC004851 [Tribolium castaneum]